MGCVALYFFAGERDGLVVKNKIVILVLHQQSEQLGITRDLSISLKVWADGDFDA